MKKLFVLVLSLMSLAMLLFGQELVSNRSGRQIEKEVNWEEVAPPASSLSQEELQGHLSNWKALHSLSLSEYLAGFQGFLESALPFYEMQPYLLAECLWFRVSILPHYQQVEREGSLDDMMELNMVVLPDIQSSVSGFLTKLGEGALPVHPWSDAVLSIFHQLVLNPPAARTFSRSNSQGALLVGENMPSLPALTVDHVFMPVGYGYRSAQLYRGIMDFEALLEQFRAAGESEGEESPSGQSAELPSQPQAEPPSPPGIDWENVVANHPLMYLLAHSESGKDLYSALREHHSGQTQASLCEDSYLECCKIGEQWGFTLEEILPGFSAAAARAVKEDSFILYCLPENDLEQVASDLACLKEIAPIYFSQAAALLYRQANNGGSL